MIEISRKNREPLIIEDATTVKEAVEYAVRNQLSLEGADLRGKNLREANLTNANLTNADLTNADLTNADLSYAYLLQVDLSHADLTEAYLQYTKLNGANLTGACLADANLSYSYLSDANLTGTVLSGTVLTRAELSGADLSGAYMDYSCFPLWCGSLDVKIDKKIFCQLLYHVLRAGKSVDDEEVKNLFSIPEIVKLANQFHRADECGIIKQGEKTE